MNEHKKLWYPDIGDVKKKVNTNSWFTSKIQKSKIKYPKLFCDRTNSDLNLLTRTNMIRIFPNENQKNILLKWFELYRLMYNKTIHFMNINHHFHIENDNISFNTLRDYWLKGDKLRLLKNGVPSHTLDNAIKDVCKAYKTALVKIKNKNIKHFRIRYKKKSCAKQSLVLEKSVFSKTDNTFCVRVLGKKIECDYDLKSINHDCRLQYNSKKNRMLLFIPEDKKVECKTREKEICGIDPGERTMFTLYSSNEVEHIGIDTEFTIKTYLSQIDEIQSRNKISKRRKNKAILKRYQKLTNKIRDLHWKVSNYLCNKYNHIMIGNFSTTDCIKNGKSKLSDMNKRILSTQSHYLFRMRLKSKCEEYNVKYQEINEYNTTKMCSFCETLKNIGASKIYNCDNCSLVIDRDINSAINILVKGLK